MLGLLVKGFTFQEIGGLLAISAHTVTTHVKHIYEKLEVRSRAEAVYEATAARAPESGAVGGRAAR